VTEERELSPRCARGRHCEDRIVDTGVVAGKVGALLVDEQYAFCPTDLRQIRYALGRLPLDVAELTIRMQPSSQVRYRDPSIPAQPRVKLYSPVPIDLNAEGLRQYVDFELAAWAKSTADDAGVEWSVGLAAAMRQGARVQASCWLLDQRLDWLLGLPLTRHRCRSAGADPTEGHHEDYPSYIQEDMDGDGWWIHRDGTHAGLLILDLHRRVEQLIGRVASDMLELPCPKCSTPALEREHPPGLDVAWASIRPGRAGQVVCRRCWHVMNDDEYARYVGSLAVELLGVWE
jgi:hypothetical protein